MLVFYSYKQYALHVLSIILIVLTLALLEPPAWPGGLGAIIAFIFTRPHRRD